MYDPDVLLEKLQTVWKHWNGFRGGLLTSLLRPIFMLVTQESIGWTRFA